MSVTVTVYDVLHSEYARNFDNQVIQRMISKLNNNMFYLGGQIKMNGDQHIGLEDVEKTREITRKRLIEYGGPCNSWEMHSINASARELDAVEGILRLIINKT
jgi:hypothetical protein